MSEKVADNQPRFTCTSSSKNVVDVFTRAFFKRFSGVENKIRTFGVGAEAGVEDRDCKLISFTRGESVTPC